MKTPVALLIFKRPDTTKKVFEAIRQAKPPKLLVVADGPRADRPGEAEKCAAARAVIDGVDWDCEVLKNYSDKNLGCGLRPATGINWVFEQVEEAIILEDDCIPNPTFFRFCDELLEKYRHNQSIMQINGTNYQLGRSRTEYSYYFSRYPAIWGWASWRRAWNHFDFDMKNWSELRNSKWLNEFHESPKIANYWRDLFDKLEFDKIHNKVHVWDGQWVFSCWMKDGFVITPNCNLISNIGFNAEATHTTSEVVVQANMPTKAIDFPLKHPPSLTWNKQADDFMFNSFFQPSLLTRVERKIKRTLKI